MDEFNIAHAKEVEVQDQWRPSQHWGPPSGKYKLNFDGAVNKATKMGGTRIIITNGEGEVMGAYVSSISICGVSKFSVKIELINEN